MATIFNVKRTLSGRTERIGTYGNINDARQGIIDHYKAHKKRGNPIYMITEDELKTIAGVEYLVALYNRQYNKDEVKELLSITPA